jgi:hypothetical protein
MITADHVRNLLNRTEGDATLVLLRGRVEVMECADADVECCRGAMTIVSRRDLVERLGGDRLASVDLEAVAAELDSAVTHQGG